MLLISKLLCDDMGSSLGVNYTNGEFLYYSATVINCQMLWKSILDVQKYNVMLIIISQEFGLRKCKLVGISSSIFTLIHIHRVVCCAIDTCNTAANDANVQIGKRAW